MSISNALKPSRTDSLFNDECYKTPNEKRKQNDPDANMKESEYYIRQKIELGTIAERVSYSWMKYVIIGILIVYMYGAMSLKYVSGA